MDSSDRDYVRILSTGSPLSCFLSYLTKFVATSIKDYVRIVAHPLYSSNSNVCK
ncbi:predicted protein [Botrytis cinerea T4]|uniref:Uncharacterized protein n=1 Tax=Botryotinia fuckeliana (strain T4) TaxID=999810 RepID=G2YJW5_BOTF4|nr:predicted protein [Botrytis cinerea T4]